MLCKGASSVLPCLIITERAVMGEDSLILLVGISLAQRHRKEGIQSNFQ